MDAIRAERNELKSLGRNAFTFYFAILLAKNIDTSADNLFLVVPYVVLIASFLWWFKQMMVKMLARATAAAAHRRKTMTSLDQIEPSMQSLMIMPMKWSISTLDLGTRLLVSKLSVLLANIMQSLLPNSHSGDVQGDTTIQTLPPIMLAGGLFFLCMESIDGSE